MNNISQTPRKAEGLDSIRFICALWVFFGHGAGPEIKVPFAQGSLPELFVRGVTGNLWVGPAAVIVFFIISGFCIHFPYVQLDRKLELGKFYARRLIRLAIPVAVAVPVSSWIGVNLYALQVGILWSLIAELIYYVIYPLLRRLRSNLGNWNPLITGSFLVALVVAFSDRTAGNYPSFGPWLNWVLGLPCWLLGCQLAESFHGGRLPRPILKNNIWLMRFGILMVAMACSILRFHSPIGYPWTLNFFALLAVLWLHHEIQHHGKFKPSRILEWAGLWSYSLYLMHPAMEHVFASFSKGLEADYLGFGWVARVSSVLAGTYVFYLLVERPSHWLARKSSVWLNNKQVSKVAVALPQP